MRLCKHGKRCSIALIKGFLTQPQRPVNLDKTTLLHFCTVMLIEAGQEILKKKEKGSNPGESGVSAVLRTTGTLTINLNSISISRVLRGSTTIYLWFLYSSHDMVCF